MRPSHRRILRMNNSVDSATSSYRWGKKPKHYSGVAGKTSFTTNFEMKDSDRKDEQ